MENNVEEAVLVELKGKRLRKRRKSRDTVLTRVDRKINEEVKGLSKRMGQTMAWINDHALQEYLKSKEPLD